MRIETETVQDKQKVLILSKKNFPFIDLFKQELRNYGADVFFSSELPLSLTKFDYCFLINQKYVTKDNAKLPKNKLIHINYDQNHCPTDFLHKKIKIINLQGDLVSKDTIDKILWFSFSESKEKLITFRIPRQKNEKIALSRPIIIKMPSIKGLIIGFIIFLILFNLSFICPLFLTSIFCYKSYKSFRTENSVQTLNYLNSAENSLKITKKMYSFSRPVLLFFSISIFPDNVISIEEKSIRIIKNLSDALENSKVIFKTITEKEEIIGKKEFISSKIKSLRDRLDDLEEDLSILNQEIPNKNFLKSIKTELNQGQEYISKATQIVGELENFLGKDSEKTYLMLFANDMELRPGGGFIGSFGLAKFKDLSLEEIKIYDVYDADGQLKAHIDPPEAIRNYLNQPHWFLRDSGFSPDFLENYSQAKFFLEKELNLNDFAGAVLFTTSSVKNLLEAFDNILVPDYNEIVNSQNFYLKAQVYSEKNFFPGSIQKKTFLGSLLKSVLLNLDKISVKTLISEFKKSLDEKKLVIYSDSPKIQKILDSFYWSGRLIEPACPKSVENCISDFIFPVDANLGVNKANFFITRLINLKIFLENENTLKHYLSIQFKNESPSEVFPGGNYKNYFQLYLPKNTTIKSITKDGTLVEDYSQKISGEFNIIGFLVEVKVKKTVEIKVNYDVEAKLFKGRNILQLIFQKQIGSSNSDLVLKFNLDKDIEPINQNFSPLVKDNQIVYNTNLSGDKIFILEFNNNL